MKTDITSRGSVYDIITERIIAMLEKGTVPWRKPWQAKAGFPRNLVSGKPYRGINVFLLHAMSYESPVLADIQTGAGAWRQCPQG